jgi:hypothetical protein
MELFEDQKVALSIPLPASITQTINTSSTQLLTRYDESSQTKLNEIHSMVSDLTTSVNTRDRASDAFAERIRAVENGPSSLKAHRWAPSQLIDEMVDNRDPVPQRFQNQCIVTHCKDRSRRRIRGII